MIKKKDNVILNKTYMFYDDKEQKLVCYCVACCHLSGHVVPAITSDIALWQEPV